jgi:CheY-like chemotaxis protein
MFREKLKQTREESARQAEEDALSEAASEERAPASVPQLCQDLRTPLNTLLGLAQLLKASPLGDSEAVTEILHAGTRLEQIINEASSESDSAPAHHAPIESPAEAQYKIVYIEDNLLNQQLVRRILEARKDVRLITASAGLPGLSCAREEHPDLVLLDLNLPDMHGSEVLRLLRADPKTEHTPVVVISADATASQIERLLSAGAQNYLTKPINIARFLHTVDQILDGLTTVQPAA